MSGDRDDFLTRWSRRKRTANRSEPEASSSGADPARDGDSREAQDGRQLDASVATAPSDEGAASEAAITDEELAALPKIDEISAQTDIAGFLKKGVPEALRNAALRRMWSVDPAVRDYVGDARDYAWDWNTPGSVPGSGPLLPGDDAEAVVRTLFSNRPDQQGEQRIAAGSAARSGQPSPVDPKVVGEPESHPDRHAAEQQNEIHPAEPSSGEPRESQAPSAATAGQPELQDNAAVRPTMAETRPAAPPRHRHGRARPV